MPGAATLLRDVFGFDAFRPGQEDIVTSVTQGRNVLAIMPTGGGKSLCFQLPALMRDGVTLAAAHAGALAPAIAEGAVPGELQCFGQERFDVPQAA